MRSLLLGDIPTLQAPPTLREYDNLTPNPQRITSADRRGAKGVPEVSVVTVSFNAERTIQYTIDSVTGQLDVDNVEYIVIDGGSNDSTVAILQNNDDAISYWISEPDNGISDAFNKGIALATAPIIAHLNADDILQPRHLRAALDLLNDTPEAGFCHGDMQIVRANGDTRRLIHGPEDYRHRIHRYMTVNHPTMVVRKELYEKHGLFRRELHYAMDYDLLYRFAEEGVCGLYSPRLSAVMRDDGISNTQWRQAKADSSAVQISHGTPLWVVVFRRLRDSTRIIIRNALEVRGYTGVAKILRRAINVGSGKPR